MFELSADHEEFRHHVRDFAAGEVAPHVAQWTRDHHFPANLIPKMGELGLFGLVVPEEYGGSGMPHAWPSRNSVGSTSRSASPWRRASAWGSTRS